MNLYQSVCVASEFDVSKVDELPDVNIVYFSVDADPKMVAKAPMIWPFL